MRKVGLPFGVLALVGVLLLASAPHGRAVSASVTSITADFLFDFGDGSYTWSAVVVPDPNAPNATWSSTLAAAKAVDVSIDWSWSTSFGVYITDIGNRSPPVGVGLYLWNRTTSQWDALLVGISSLVLRPYDSVAISDNGFHAGTYANLYPVPSPVEPYPSLQFRGDTANTGQAGATGPSVFGIAWDADLHLSEIASSPVTGYGRVYVLTLDGLFALNLTSGAVLWENRNLRGLSTPAVYDHELIFGGSDGRLHAVAPDNGTELWNVSLIPNPAFSGITSSPKIVFDTVFVGTFNESGGAGEVVAVGATNGTILWRAPAPGSVSYSSPAIANGTLYVGVRGLYNTTTGISYAPPYGLLALDAATGAERWFYPTGGSVAASPVVDGRGVVVPAADGFVYSVNAATGTLAWKVDVDAGVSSPALVEGLLVVAGGSFGGGGRVIALDGATGATRWTYTPNGPVQSSVTAAADRVYFATNTALGTVCALNLASGRLDWSYTPSPNQYILSTPAIADGRLIFASDNGHVYEFTHVQPPASAFTSLSVPSSIAAGATANLTVEVSAPNGTWDDVVVTVRVPDGLTTVTTFPESPQPIVTRFLPIDIGPVPFGETRFANVTFRSNGTVASATLDIGLVVTTGGGFFTASLGSPLIELGSAVPLWVFILIPVVAVGAVAVIVVLRRRSRHGP